MSDGRVYMNVREAAQYLKISKGTIYGLVRKELIPYHQIKKKILFVQNQLDEWVERKTLREKEEKVTAEEKLIRRLNVFWENIPPDTRAEINERIQEVDLWLKELTRVVKRVEETKGHCRFREADCLLKKQTQPQRPDPKSVAQKAQQPAQSPQAPSQNRGQAGPGQSQTSGGPKTRGRFTRYYFELRDRKRRELAQKNLSTAKEETISKDTQKEGTPSTGSPESEIPIEAKTPSQAEKASQVVPEPQEKVPAEHPSTSTALPSDQPEKDPVSHDQTADPLDPNLNVKKEEAEHDSQETPISH